MKVSELIARLQNLNPNQDVEILIGDASLEIKYVEGDLLVGSRRSPREVVGIMMGEPTEEQLNDMAAPDPYTGERDDGKVLVVRQDIQRIQGAPKPVLVRIDGGADIQRIQPIKKEED